MAFDPVKHFKQHSTRADRLTPRELELLAKLDEVEVDALLSIDVKADTKPKSMRVGAAAY